MSETQQTQTEEPRLIANRYRVIEKIGQGSMGTVYKVHDRLTHQAVALKQVTMSQPPPEIALNTLTSGTVDMRIALAQEFKTLATLRHPRIISVLDYGFVADLGEEFGLPFFTMELLESAQDIVTFGRSNHWISELELLMQLLQALAYLHRRGIVHRDLKPSNVLVVNGQVKVLDFGLAFVRAYGKESQATPVVGTLAYMAPETLRGVAPNEISDLYSVGVIAYQMFAGEHPFDVDDMTQFIEDLLNTEPDLSRLDTMPEIIEIIGRLLSKDPARRFASANDVLNAIRAATGQTIILDSTTRESYLQAARFVGRSEELATLTVALHQAMNRLGSSWLVAGESGVGKSRLLDELRTQALVSGCIVLRGESVPGPGLPYKLWRESLRRMLLMIEISVLEASILKEIVPGLPELIGRDIPDASRIEGQPGQLRLVNTIVDVFKRTTQPVILLLEDLHWSIESLEPLKALAQNAHNLPLMIVGTYRDDERPDLPDELPEMKPIKLERLSPDEIAELSESMLGEVGRQGEIVGLLQRETEGNTFFIVEVVRALAEQAGDLENVGVTTLPDQVFTGGVRAFVQRRLDRVPEDARPLLHLAAVAGRRINLEVMQAAIDSLPEDERYDLNRWLTNCADAAVLMIQEETWHFAHDKLREALLETIEPDELPSLHRQVAHGIETAYPDDETRSVSLVEHWRAGGNVEKTINHAIIAAERALLVGAFEEGKKLLLSVLESMDDKLSTSHRLSLLILLGAMFWRTSDYDEGALYYAESLALAYEIDDKANIARALNGLSFIDTLREDYATARERSQLALSFAEQADDPLSSARALSNLGVVAESDSDYDSAHAYYERSLAIFREQGDQRGIASVLNNLGSIADSQGRIEEASQYYNESLEICRAIDFRHGIATLLNNLGILYERQNNLQQAGKTYLESLSISEAIGDRRGCAHSYTNLSFVSIALEEYDQARHHVESALHITHSLEISYIMPHVLVAYAWLYLIDGAPEFSAEIVGSILQIDALDEDFCNLRLNPLLERLDATLPPEKHEAAIKQGSIQPIHKMIKVVLDRISSAG